MTNESAKLTPSHSLDRRQNAFGYGHAVNLRWALVNPHDAHFLCHELERQLLRNTHCAKRLYGMVDDFGGHLCSEDLDH